MLNVVVPKMGMSTVEVDITECFVQVGDVVKVGDPLIEVESEKATFTIESEAEGVVAELLVEEGDTVDVGTVVCVINNS